MSRVIAYGRERRLSRHARALLSHATPRKLANLALVEREYRARAVRLRGMPYLYFVDTCNYCDLRCPLCPSAGESFGRRRGRIGIDEYMSILGQIAPWAFEINLHNWGEPFLNPEIFAIVEATRAHNVMSNLSSNLNHLDESQAVDVVRCGLEYLVASVDGATAPVYAHYRVGGDLERVLDNLRAIVAAKRKLRSATPVIEWQFLVMAHNEHQMAEAQRLGEEIGVDLVRFAPAGLPFDELANESKARIWMPKSEAYHRFHPARLHASGGFFEDHHCHYLYRSMSIGPRGAVAPCCAVHAESDDVGVLGADGMRGVWNNDAYLSARRLFAGEGDGAGTPCARCVLFARPESRAPQAVSA